MYHDAKRGSRRPWIVAGCCLWLGFAGWLLTAAPDATLTTALVDSTETLVPLLAAAACLSAARRTQVAPLAWGLCGAGVLAWGLGQAVWTWYEVVRAVEVPFPSLADLGYLMFPVLASVGVAAYHVSNRPRRSSVGAVLEGVLVATSLFAISWFTLLQEMVVSWSPGAFGFWLSLAYPVGDLIMIALVLHALAQLRNSPLSLWFLGLGLTVMVVADGAFMWLTGSDTFSTGGWVDLGWITAFALIGVAGLLARHETEGEPVPVGSTRVHLLLPYVPFAIGMGVLADRAWESSLGRVELVVGALLIALVLCRQFLALADNQALLSSLRAREAELQHLALHDPLTGLANRALFSDRLTHSLGRTARVPGELTLLLVDLDDFKTVNDVHGHLAGDALLVEVAERLRGCVRSQDTVARLGGDEFALLLDPTSGPADEVAQRVLDALSRPVHVDGLEVRVSASVGIGRVAGSGLSAERVEQALRDADVAMYAAKAAGKNRWRRYNHEVGLLAQSQPQDAQQPPPVLPTQTAARVP